MVGTAGKLDHILVLQVLNFLRERIILGKLGFFVVRKLLEQSTVRIMAPHVNLSQVGDDTTMQMTSRYLIDCELSESLYMAGFCPVN